MNASRFPVPPGSPPSSPWAQRYPVHAFIEIINNTKRSLLAPQHPRIDDPKHYDQDPNGFTDRGIRSLAEIDRVNWSEKVQERSLWGMITFQLAALNRHLTFSSGPNFEPVPSGHQPPINNLVTDLPGVNVSGSPSSTPPREADNFKVYRRKGMKIDETTWLPFLRKDRWFDWDGYMPGRRAAPKPWSVDDPAVWNALRPVLELTNRILKALIDDGHRSDDWMGYVDILGDPPDENATVLFSYIMEQAVARIRNKKVWLNEAHVRTNQEVQARLEKLLAGLIWSFGEHATCHANTFEPYMAFKSITRYTILTNISSFKIQSLQNPDLTLRELCQLQLELAATMIHEISHAVIFARFADDNYVGNRSDLIGKPVARQEPYLDGEGIPEAGYYMENFVFGGILEMRPFPRGPPPPLLQALRGWPIASAAGSWPPAEPNSSYLKDGAYSRVYVMPSTWASKLCSEAFWKDPQYPRKSDNFFHNSRRFRMTAPIKNRHTLECALPRIVYRKNEPYSYPEENTLIEDWNAQKALLESISGPWAGDDYVQWNRSPWSDLKERLRLRQFAECFAKRDHLQCAAIAEYYVYHVPWHRGHDRFKAAMPTKDDVSTAYIWHAVGLLMMASLPLRREQLIEKRQPEEWIAELMPSKEAAAAGWEQTIYTHPDIVDPQEAILDGSVLFDVARPGQGGPGIKEFVQRDYMTMLSKMMGLILRLDGCIFKKFTDPINVSRKLIIEERKQLAIDYPGRAHTTRWLSKWHFELPPYEPTLSEWDRTAKGWKPLV